MQRRDESVEITAFTLASLSRPRRHTAPTAPRLKSLHERGFVRAITLSLYTGPDVLMISINKPNGMFNLLALTSKRSHGGLEGEGDWRGQAMMWSIDFEVRGPGLFELTRFDRAAVLFAPRRKMLPGLK